MAPPAPEPEHVREQPRWNEGKRRQARPRRSVTAPAAPQPFGRERQEQEDADVSRRRCKAAKEACEQEVTAEPRSPDGPDPRGQGEGLAVDGVEEKRGREESQRERRRARDLDVEVLARKLVEEVKRCEGRDE